MTADLRTLTREQLEQRRNELHVQLAAVNDALQAHARARRGDLHASIEAEEARERIAADRTREHAALVPYTVLDDEPSDDVI